MFDLYIDVHHIGTELCAWLISKPVIPSVDTGSEPSVNFPVDDAASGMAGCRFAWPVYLTNWPGWRMSRSQPGVNHRCPGKRLDRPLS